MARLWRIVGEGDYAREGAPAGERGMERTGWGHARRA